MKFFLAQLSVHSKRFINLSNFMERKHRILEIAFLFVGWSILTRTKSWQKRATNA